MVLKSIKSKKTNGFTIVELLVVIVVIGILASITIVSYTGITSKANTTKALSNAQAVQQVGDVYYAENNTYPTTIALWGSAPSTAKIPASITLVADAATSPLTAANGTTHIALACKTVCSSATTGMRIAYWDFTAGASAYLYLGNAVSTDTFVYPS